MRPHRDFRFYRRRFKEPLQTARGVWSERIGWILREEQGSCISYAEVAPVPGFPGWDCDWEHWLGRWRRFDLPENEKNCPGAIASAVETLGPPSPKGPPNASVSNVGSLSRKVCTSGLLSLRPDFYQLESLCKEGYRCIKTKIGITDPVSEQATLDVWLQHSPVTVQFRLDANEGLTHTQCQQWLDWMRDRNRIQFIEQPLPRGQEDYLMNSFEVEDLQRIALDESVITLADSQDLHQMQWPGFWVIKPSLLGPASQWLSFLRGDLNRVILSSVFETGIGFTHLLALASLLPENRPVDGLGTLGYLTGDPVLDGYSRCSGWEHLIDIEKMHRIWENIGIEAQ